MFDIKEVRVSNPIEQVVGQRVQLKQDGRELRGLCPFHNEKTPSFTVVPAKQFYHCFGCGAHGDVVDFIMEDNGVDLKEACEILGGQREAPDRIYRERRRETLGKDIYEGIKPYKLANPTSPLAGKPVRVWNPKRDSWTTYRPKAVYKYSPAAYVLRIEFGDGKKITPMIMWCKWGEEEGWCHYSFPEPRPLYGGLTGKAILIVEGEKARDAAAKVMSEHYDVVTWAGGTQVPGKTDWTPLKGKKVLLWGDADAPGEGAMVAISNHLAATVKVEELKLLEWDKNKPKGWDAADAVDSASWAWKLRDVVEWAKGRTLILVKKGAITATATNL